MIANESVQVCATITDLTHWTWFFSWLYRGKRRIWPNEPRKQDISPV